MHNNPHNEQMKDNVTPFGEIFQQAAVGMMILDLNTRNLWKTNATMEEMLGYTETEFSRMTLSEITHPEDTEKDSNLFVQVLNGEIHHYHQEKRYIRKSGEVFWGKLTFHLLLHEGQHWGFGIIEDINKRKEAEEERQQLEARLRHAQKMEAIGTLSGGIAHDFNNLLFGILGYAEMMREELPSDHPLQRYAQSLITAGKRAKDLVRQILAFSRQDEQEFSNMQVIPIIKEVLKMMRSTLPTTITIQQELISQSKSIWGSPIQIHQIIVNLCTNAEQAMRQTGGILKIKVSEIELDLQEALLLNLKPGTFLKLTVQDTGPGIPAEIQDRIFDPFFTTKPVGEGTGLGLSVVHGIVLEHQGAITIQSEDGKGTAFHIFFPAIEGKSDEPQLPSIEVFRGKERILVVDDEIFILDMVEKMLSRLGYQVTAIQSSAEALEQFSANPEQFDLIITDQTMPKLTGYQLAQGILAISPNTPIILMTGFSHQVSIEEAEKIGIRRFINKPVEKEILANVVHELLEERIKNDSS
ncbi:MAG: response regulator [SAR324 cluster bacterium]|nr:response regulator [SAR324 cluster bacterium]